MLEGYKFEKVEDIVLYAIAENRKPILRDQIYKHLPEINKKLIDSTLRKLIKSDLIAKSQKSFSLKTSKGSIYKTKKILKNHWETNWEVEWKNATKI